MPTLVPRRSTHPRPDSDLADIRAHFELPQWEMAGLLRVSEAYYRLLEADKRRLNRYGLLLAAALVATVPTNPNRITTPIPLPLPAAPPAYAAVVKRLDQCQMKSWHLRREAIEYRRLDRAAANWRAALPALRAHPAFADAHAQAWLDARTTELLPYELLEWRLLEARIVGLETEATALRALLADAPAAP